MTNLLFEAPPEPPKPRASDREFLGLVAHELAPRGKTFVVEAVNRLAIRLAANNVTNDAGRAWLYRHVVEEMKKEKGPKAFATIGK